MLGQQGNVGNNPQQMNAAQYAASHGVFSGVDPTSLINSLNALINADITRDWLLIEKWLQTTGSLIIIGVILVIVMLLAAYEFLK